MENQVQLEVLLRKQPSKIPINGEKHRCCTISYLLPPLKTEIPGSTKFGTVLSEKSYYSPRLSRLEEAPTTEQAEQPMDKTPTPRSSNDIKLLRNYLRISSPPGWALYKYEVHFQPKQKNEDIRRKLLRDQVDLIGCYMYDGVFLYKASLLYKEIRVQGVRLKFLGKVEREDEVYLTYYNLTLRKCFRGLNLKEFLFKVTTCHHYGLQLRPGYIFSIRKVGQEFRGYIELINYIHGLNENIKTNPSVMEEIAEHVEVDSAKQTRAFQYFFSRLQLSRDVMREIGLWGIIIGFGPRAVRAP